LIQVGNHAEEVSDILLVDAYLDSFKISLEVNFIGFVCDNHGCLVGWLSL
jgi:hypothetical protein